MKHLLLLCLMVAAPFVRASKITLQKPMDVYSGKYVMTVNGNTGYIQITPKDDHLVLLETWTGDKYNLKHLSGDNFIMEIRGWAVQFNRDKKGAVVSVEVMRKDLWTKVK
ncbi:DUF3471 domain-containing protein [Mucilaginibacter sp. dw_454]|uniref:DUF3471 domain-containing protein n=1 Tax=Mucilaginibacter sp. dw_454 TaxID=2720079 RepID=UPI001BD6C0CB|nr:DUF3471 domain-containing protein [Mucilaginibacter sp. dw_454]